ncbi:MAG: hypothetical protein H6R26_960 [Proteobacteria bacterium]|nr:hypothetical protein [Pseudomonadota bacterium]
MSQREDEELEQRLRAVFEPEAESVDRVVRVALHSPYRRPMMLRIATVLALVGALVVLLVLTRPRSDLRAESLRLEYVGDLALFEFPDGSCWLVTPDEKRQGSHAPLNLILVEGDEP